MKYIVAIFNRELKSYFSSQIFYIISAVFILVTGNMFKNIFLKFSSDSMALLRYRYEYGAAGLSFINVNFVAVKTFNNINFIL